MKSKLVVRKPQRQPSVRTPAIPQQAADLLRGEHKKHISSRYKFPSLKTGTMFDPDSFRSTYDKILKAMEYIQLHELLTHVCGVVLKSGVDVKTVASMPGHDDAGFALSTTPTLQQTRNAARRLKPQELSMECIM